MSNEIRMGLLKDMFQTLNKYTHQQENWRPGLVDLAIYNELSDMHESSTSSVEMADYIWKRDVDYIMNHILETNHFFDSALEFGSEQLYEELNDYLVENDFIVDPMDIDDEEYQQLLEGEI